MGRMENPPNPKVYYLFTVAYLLEVRVDFLRSLGAMGPVRLFRPVKPGRVFFFKKAVYSFLSFSLPEHSTLLCLH